MARIDDVGKPVLLEQLSAELGVEVTGEMGAVEAPGVSQKRLEAAVAAHTPTARWDRPDLQRLDAARARAGDILAGVPGASLTLDEMQQLLAALVVATQTRPEA